MVVTRVALYPEQGAAGSLNRTAVSHIGFTVPDVDKTAHFYQKILGMHVHNYDAESDAMRLGWGSGHHTLELTTGAPGLSHFGFEVRDDGGLDGIRERLTAAGIDHRQLADRWIDEAVGTPDGIEVTDPDGNQVHFHSAVKRQGENSADTGRRPVKFQHTTIGTDNLTPLLDFFVATIGFHISDQLSDGRFAWLRSDPDHHTLAIVNVGKRGGLDHYSYDLAQWEDFKQWCDRLTELGVDVQWGPGRHGPGNNLFIFFDDPAGNHIELSAEMEKFYDDRVAYVPRQWAPIPNTINLWGGQLPKWRKTSESGDN